MISAEQKIIECLVTIADLLREIRDDARQHYSETVEDRTKLADRLDKFEGYIDCIDAALNDIRPGTKENM